MNRKSLLSTFFWLSGLFILVYIIATAGISLLLGNSGLDISLHNTFPARSLSRILVLPLFLLSAFLVFFVKELRYAHSRALPNSVILLSGLALLCGWLFLRKQIIRSGIETDSRTSYPPLSALQERRVQAGAAGASFFSHAINFSSILLFVIVICLLWMAYGWGRAVRNKKGG